MKRQETAVQQLCQRGKYCSQQ